MRIRSRLALFIGQTIYRLGGRRLRKRGWPGLVSQWIDPGILEELTSRLVVNIVCGSSGATTTGALIAHGLRGMGLNTIVNEPDALSKKDLITTLLMKRDETHAVLVTALTDVAEVVEASQPDVLTVTTLSFDRTLDRGMIDKVVMDMKRVLSDAHPSLVLCSDDALVSSISINTAKDSQSKRVREQTFFYAEAPYRMSTTTGDNWRTPYRTSHCPLCSRELIYDAVSSGSAGLYHCSNCGFRNPRVDLYYQVDDSFLTINWQRSGLTAGASTLRRESRFQFRGDLAARYAAASIATLHRLLPAADLVKIQNIVCSFRPQFTQQEYYGENNHRLIIQVTGEVYSLGERLEQVMQDSSVDAVVIWLSHPPRTPVDNSWIWDIDFGQIIFPPECQIILTGEDAPLLQLAMLQQGADMSAISLVTETDELLHAVKALTSKSPTESCFYLLADHYALRTMPKLLESMGYKKRRVEKRQVAGS